MRSQRLTIGRWWRLPVLFQALLGSALFAGAPACRSDAVVQQRQLVILTSGTTGAFHPMGVALASLYSREIPGIVATAQPSRGSQANLDAIRDGKGDVALAQGDLAYVSYAADPTRAPLRALAVLFPNTVHIVVRRASGISRVEQFRGRLIGIAGSSGSGGEPTARAVLENYGLSYADLTPQFAGFAELVSRLQAGTIDAAILVANHPLAALGGLDDDRVRVLSLEPESIERIRSSFPFFERVVIPAGTYHGQNHDVMTVGIDNLLICRADLDEQLAYDLTRVLFESLPDLRHQGVLTRGIDADKAPASPLPLHAGAAQYYRERQLFR